MRFGSTAILTESLFTRRGLVFPIVLVSGIKYTNQLLWLVKPCQLRFTESAEILFTDIEDGAGLAQEIQEVTSIKKDSIANLTLFNPDGISDFLNENILSTSKNSAFLGKKLKGKVYGVFANKKLVLN